MHVPSKPVGLSAAQLTESPLRDFEALIRSHAPIIAVESNEEPQVVRMVRQIAQKLQLKPFRWSATEGLQAFDPADQPKESVQKSLEVLNYVKNSAHSCLFVLLDFHPFLEDTLHVRSLKDIALSYEKHYSTVVMVGYLVRVPEELRPFTSYFKLPLPSAGELRQIVHEVAAEWGAANGNRDVQTTNKTLDLLVRNLAGLTATDARRLAL
ncbi:MAG TPA: ATPase, partial [Verrucomicrobiae bacterium]|nr:ATPase [Verrucomicrobiae bacterium]